MNIDKLTEAQVEMCEIMWSFDSAEEYLEWYQLLDEQDQRQADVLQRLIIHESMEEMLTEVHNQYADVRAYLKKFML
mgnify:CR=1 FL=1